MSSQYNCVLENPSKSASHFNYDNMSYWNIVHQYHSRDEYANLMHQQRNYGNVLFKPCCNQQSYSRIITKAIRKVTYDNSLFPHGDPMPEDWIDIWYERLECPRLKWIYQENPSWQPTIENQHGEYSGTQLIQVKGDDALITSCKQLNDFYANIRPQTWQVVSENANEDIEDALFMTNDTSDYEIDDSHSDTSSEKSRGLSADWFTRTFLGALW